LVPPVEIDKLPWSAFDFASSEIRSRTRHFSAPRPTTATARSRSTRSWPSSFAATIWGAGASSSSSRARLATPAPTLTLMGARQA